MKMTDYEDYENNLAFPPEGDWSDTEPKNNTDRTASTIELVNKIEGLNKWLDLKSEYISKIEEKNERLQELLKKCVEWLTYIDRDNGIIAEIDKLLGEDE